MITVNMSLTLRICCYSIAQMLTEIIISSMYLITSLRLTDFHNYYMIQESGFSQLLVLICKITLQIALKYDIL